MVRVIEGKIIKKMTVVDNVGNYPRCRLGGLGAYGLGGLGA